jgi:hypothetical protein
MNNLNVKCQSFLNYVEFRPNHEPYMVHGKWQIISKTKMSNPPNPPLLKGGEGGIIDWF